MSIHLRITLSSYLVFALTGCVVSTEAVPGPPGAQGDDGTAAVIGEATCDVGDYVTGVDESGTIICAPGPDTETLQQQLLVLQSRLDSIQATLDAEYVEGPGSETGPTFSLVIPQSKLGGAFRTVLLTIRASGTSCLLARTYLVHTGADNTGVSVNDVGALGSYGTCSVEVTGNLGFSASGPSDNDSLKGVTVDFSAMPAQFIYRYGVKLIGAQQ